MYTRHWPPVFAFHLRTMPSIPSPSPSTPSSSPAVVQIGFSPSEYEVSEDSGVVAFKIVNENPHMEREVTIVFTTIGGSASG